MYLSILESVCLSVYRSISFHRLLSFPLHRMCCKRHITHVYACIQWSFSLPLSLPLSILQLIPPVLNTFSHLFSCISPVTYICLIPYHLISSHLYSLRLTLCMREAGLERAGPRTASTRAKLLPCLRGASWLLKLLRSPASLNAIWGYRAERLLCRCW